MSTGFSRIRPERSRGGAFLAVAILSLAISGCTTPGKPTNPPATSTQSSADQPSRFLQDIDPPRKIGVVENSGLQTPVISPDGRQMLYLRLDQPHASPMTLLGGTAPADGTLSIWLRPVQGAVPGKRISPQRWAHSPTWSDSGRSIAYIANEPAGTAVVHLDLVAGKESRLGLAGAFNCFPCFDGDDRTLLFAAGQSPDSPFRIYRQAIGDAQPTPVSPEGMDCLLPVRTNTASQTLCAQASQDHLNWVWADQNSTHSMAIPWAQPGKLLSLQVWAGIPAPVSPDRDGVLFYDTARDRVCALHISEKVVRQHRPGSIAGCWFDSRTIALATPTGVFITDTRTGRSAQLLSGSWIPCRYVPSDRRLILLGQEPSQFFAIWEVSASTRNRL